MLSHGPRSSEELWWPGSSHGLQLKCAHHNFPNLSVPTKRRFAISESLSLSASGGSCVRDAPMYSLKTPNSSLYTGHRRRDPGNEIPHGTGYP
eukprot:2489269-Rhodomonas_salina.1